MVEGCNCHAFLHSLRLHLVDQKAIQNDLIICSADFVNTKIVDKIRTPLCSQYSVTLVL